MLPTSIDIFLEPIPGANPCGEFLRYTPVYDAIKEARREDDQQLDQGVWVTSFKRADWAEVEKICTDALLKRSKDVQIATNLCEAWVYQHGLSGLKIGIKLASALYTTFWEDLHPTLQDGSTEFRVSPMDWINEKLSVKLKQIIKITQPRSRDIPSYTWVDWEQVLNTDKLAIRDIEGYEQAIAEGKLSREKFMISMNDTPTASLEEITAMCAEIIADTKNLEDFLDEKCGKDAPTLRLIREYLTNVQTNLNVQIKERRKNEPPPVEVKEEIPEEIIEEYSEEIREDFQHVFEEVLQEQKGEHSMSTEKYTPEISRDGVIRTRSDAYRMLNEAANFLQKTEPHSPVPYLVRRAIAWGQKPLHELLQELVTNPDELFHLFNLLGMSNQGNDQQPEIAVGQQPRGNYHAPIVEDNGW